MDEIFCTDLTSFVKEEIILEDSGSTSSSDIDVPSPISETEEIVNVRKFVKSQAERFLNVFNFTKFSKDSTSCHSTGLVVAREKSREIVDSSSNFVFTELFDN